MAAELGLHAATAEGIASLGGPKLVEDVLAGVREHRRLDVLLPRLLGLVAGRQIQSRLLILSFSVVSHDLDPPSER
jgi:hypothetical protein